MNKPPRPKLRMAASAERDAARIMADPQFRTLVKRRSGFAWTLTGVMVAVYLGFVLLAAFAKPLMATPVLGVTSLGIVLGIAVILLAFALTGIYVGRANREFDALTAAIKERA